MQATNIQKLKIFKPIPFTTAIKSMKNLQINLTKDLNTAKYKTGLTDIKTGIS